MTFGKLSMVDRAPNKIEYMYKNRYFPCKTGKNKFLISIIVEY